MTSPSSGSNHAAHVGTFVFRNSAMIRTTILATLLLGISTRAQATHYFVNASASGSANGLSWTDAFTNLQEALSIVVPGDEIWVAAGQYKPTTGTTRTISFQVRNGVDVYGGFAGNETDLSQRDVATNPTVLNGDIGEPGNSADNCHTVVTADNLTTTVILDGFRIMNGYSAAGSSYNGGGLRITNTLSGNVVLRQCAVLNNFSGTYGGGMYIASVRLTIENCEFNNNQAGSGSGGAVCNGNVNGSGSIVTIQDSRFKNNSARVGACLYNSQSYNELVIDRCIFTNNTSENSILSFDDFESAQLLNSYVIGNTVDGFSSNVINVNSTTQEEVFSMINCTVAHNFNTYANTIQTEIIRFFDPYHVITNSIVHGNTVVDGRQVTANAIISNSIIEGGHAGGTNIIDQIPQFAAPYVVAQGGFDATDFDYSLLPFSPAINAGSNDAVLVPYDLDLALLPRIQGGIVDLGCYETDQTVGLDVQQISKGWYFDGSRNEIHLPPSPFPRHIPIAIHDTNGKLIASLSAATDVIRVELPVGAYLAVAADLGTLLILVQ